jgi:hypothetical protein
MYFIIYPLNTNSNLAYLHLFVCNICRLPHELHLLYFTIVIATFYQNLHNNRNCNTI